MTTTETEECIHENAEDGDETCKQCGAHIETFYVLTAAHVTFTKWAIVAESLDQAKAFYAEDGNEAGEYVGYIDADWDNGPEPDWSEPDNSYVEGH